MRLWHYFSEPYDPFCYQDKKISKVLLTSINNLKINRFAKICCKVGFSKCFWTCWMGMANSSNIFTAGSILHSKGSLINHFSSTRPNYMCSKHTVCVLICQNLYKAICVIITLSSWVCRKGEFSNSIFYSLGIKKAIRFSITKSVSNLDILNYM